MPVAYETRRQPTIPHGDTTALFPVTELGAPIHQDRDAQRRREELDDDAVLLVTPDGMASGYALSGHPLTLIEVDGLSETRREDLEAAADITLDGVTHIQVGRTIRSGRNRSLSEFGT